MKQGGRRGIRWVRVLGTLALAALAACGGGDKSAQKLFDRGAAHYAKRDYDRAIADFQEGLKLEPNSAVGYNLLGMAYRWKYNTVRAGEWKEREVEAFRLAVAADTTFWPAYVNLGASLYYMGKKREAAPLFNRALVLNPDLPDREELEKFIREGGAEPPPLPAAADSAGS